MSCDTDQLRVSDASVSLCVVVCVSVFLCAPLCRRCASGCCWYRPLINQSMKIIQLRFIHVKTNHFVTMTLE